MRHMCLIVTPMTCTESENPSPRGFRNIRPFRTAATDPDHLLHARPDLWTDLIVWNLLRLAAHGESKGTASASDTPFP